MNPAIRIYTKDPCPYCDRAIRLLEEKKISFIEDDLTGKWDEIDRIKEKYGWRTVPIILLNEKLVGGYTELKALDEQGGLDHLIPTA